MKTSTSVSRALQIYNSPQYPFNSIRDIAAVNQGRGRSTLHYQKGHGKRRGAKKGCGKKKVHRRK